MTQEQRKLFAEGMVNLANIVAGALIFGQVVSGHVVDFGIVSMGIIFAGIFYLAGYMFSKHD